MKHTTAHLTRRILMSVCGVVTGALSVGMFRHAALGVDPFQTLMSGLGAVIPIRYGTLYVLVNLLLLGFSLLTDRRKIGLATFINLFLLGYIVEFSQAQCERLLPAPSLGARVLLLLAAVVILSLATALYFTADLGVSTYDTVALVWSERQKSVPFPVCRVITDSVCVVSGAALCLLSGRGLKGLFAAVGVGTLVTAFFMGPLIDFFNRRVARPLLGGDG